MYHLCQFCSRLISTDKLKCELCERMIIINVPFKYKEQIKKLYNIKWNDKIRSWYTNSEHNANIIEDYIDNLLKVKKHSRYNDINNFINESDSE